MPTGPPPVSSLASWRAILSDPRSARHEDRVLKLGVALLMIAVAALVYKAGSDRPAPDSAFGAPPQVACPTGKAPKTIKAFGPAFSSPDGVLNFVISRRFPDLRQEHFTKTVGTSRARYVRYLGTAPRIVLDVQGSGTLPFLRRWRVDALVACYDVGA